MGVFELRLLCFSLRDEKVVAPIFDWVFEVSERVSAQVGFFVEDCLELTRGSTLLLTRRYSEVLSFFLFL